MLRFLQFSDDIQWTEVHKRQPQQSHSATTDVLTTTPQPWLPLQMLLELPEEQFYSHGRPACSSCLRQTPFSH